MVLTKQAWIFSPMKHNFSHSIIFSAWLHILSNNSANVIFNAAPMPWGNSRSNNELPCLMSAAHAFFSSYTSCSHKWLFMRWYWISPYLTWNTLVEEDNFKNLLLFKLTFDHFHFLTTAGLKANVVISLSTSLYLISPCNYIVQQF